MSKDCLVAKNFWLASSFVVSVAVLIINIHNYYIDTSVLLEKIVIVNYNIPLVKLTTPENTITYHNALCLSPQILHKHCFQFFLGPF